MTDVDPKASTGIFARATTEVTSLAILLADCEFRVPHFLIPLFIADLAKRQIKLSVSLTRAGGNA
jgi:hypothetical protein